HLDGLDTHIALTNRFWFCDLQISPGHAARRRYPCARKCRAEPRCILHYPGDGLTSTRDYSVPESYGQDYEIVGKETAVFLIVSWGDWCPRRWFDYDTEYLVWLGWILSDRR